MKVVGAGVTRAGAGRLPGDHAALSASHEVPSPRRAEWRWPCSRRVNAKQAPLDPALGQGVPPGPRGQGLATLLTAPGQGSSKQLLGRRGMGGQAKRAEPPRAEVSIPRAKISFPRRLRCPEVCGPPPGSWPYVPHCARGPVPSP